MENRNFPVKFLFDFSIKQSSKKKCYYILSFISCLLVCLVSLVSKTILNQAPIIFLMISEIEAGEKDIVLTPRKLYKVDETGENSIFNEFLNYTLLNDLFKKTKSLKDLQPIPRLELQGKLGKNLVQHDVILIDSDIEKENELGRNYPYGKMINDECIINTESLKGENFGLGDYVPINIQVGDLVKGIMKFSSNNSSIHSQNLSKLNNLEINTKCIIAHISEKNYGKERKNRKKVVFLELKFFLDIISKSIPNNIKEFFSDISSILNQANLNDFSSNIVVNFNKPRTDFYLVSEYETLLQKSTSKANHIKEVIGVNNNIIVSLPLVEKLKNFFLGSVFLGLIINIIVVILVVLSIILIYSLLVISVETSTFDMGMLRLIGTTKGGLISIILFQCLLFSVPSFILSIILHIPLLNKISDILQDLSGSDTKLGVNFQSMIYAFLMSNVSPIIAAILPIRSLLSKNLSTAINNIQSKTSGVKIEIISTAVSERKSLIYFGVLNCLYGIAIYYFLPLSLLSFNLGLLLSIFLWILVGMLLGFIILSLNIEYLMQKLVTFICLFWVRSYVKTVILKNLSAHIIRNRKTSLMYSLSVGFFIMITVGYNLEMTSLKFNELGKRGAYYELTNPNYYINSPIMFTNTIKYLLENDCIYDYTYVFAPIHEVTDVQKTEVWNSGKSFQIKTNFVAVSPNYFNATLNNFLMINDNEKLFDGSKEIILSEQLYMKKNDGKFGMSGIFTHQISLSMEDNFFLTFSNDASIMQFISKPAFIIDNAPGIFMSSQPTSKGTRNVILPIHVYADLLFKANNYFSKDETPLSYPLSDLPIMKLNFKIDEKKDPNKFAKISQMINEDPNYIVDIWDFYEFDETINKIEGIMNFIFNSVSVIVMVFCFFNLSASMTINIFEQSKEISIYRSIGVRERSLIFIYICESFILIFSSSLIGLLVGTVLSWTMTLQRITFTNLPLIFYFPSNQLLLILIVSIIGAFISTFFPAKRLLKRQIAEILKYN